MGIIHNARAFVQGLLSPRKPGRPGQCPHCGSTLTKKNGTYERTLRDLGGIRTIRVQRHRCCACGRTFSDDIPEIARHRWYTRRVQRKYLDLYVTIGGSLRRCADWLTAEITGRGRTLYGTSWPVPPGGGVHLSRSRRWP